MYIDLGITGLSTRDSLSVPNLDFRIRISKNPHLIAVRTDPVVSDDLFFSLFFGLSQNRTLRANKIPNKSSGLIKIF